MYYHSWGYLHDDLCDCRGDNRINYRARVISTRHLSVTCTHHRNANIQRMMHPREGAIALKNELSVSSRIAHISCIPGS